MNLAQQFLASASRMGVDLAGSSAQLETYIAGRMVHLNSIVDQAGFEEALLAEAHAAALMLSGLDVEQADEVDARLVGFARGALSIAARALVAV